MLKFSIVYAKLIKQYEEEHLSISYNQKNDKEKEKKKKKIIMIICNRLTY